MCYNLSNNKDFRVFMSKKEKVKSKKIKKASTFGVMWKVMSGGEKFKFILLMILGLISSLAVLIPTQIISIIVSKLSGETVSILGIVIPDSINYGTIIIVGAVVTFLMRTITATYDLTIEKLIKKIVANIHNQTYDWLVTPRKNMDLKMTQGDAIYRINQAPELVTEVMVDFFSMIIPDVLSAVIAFVYILFLDIKTIIVLLIGILIVLLCVLIRVKIEKKISFRTEKAKSAMSSTISNTISNLPLIYLYKSMLHESTIFKGRVDNYYKEQKKQINLRWFYWLGVRVAQVASTFIIIYLCAKQVYMGTLIVGNVVIVANYVAQVFSPIQTIGYFAARWIQCSVAVDRLTELEPKEKQLLPVKSEEMEEIETIELSHISAENSGFNLIDANLKLKKDELVVVSGESGCGKSTLIKILCGLCEKTGGDIIINGEKRLKSAYQAVGKMSVSMQDAYIFNRDIDKNILYPDGNYEKEDYKPVIEDLSLNNVFKRKYNDESEQALGNMLSGGEKKRIGISRALIKKADVYIFDEPTNDLDNANAKKVIKSIVKLKKKAIVVVVSHDDRVKAVADRLVVFHERGILNGESENETSDGTQG